MKKLILSLFTVAAVWTLSISAAAAEPQEACAELELGDRLIQCGGYPEASEYAARFYSMDWDRAKAALVTGMKDWAESIDISAFEIPATRLSDLCTEVINENPALFYVESSVHYSRTDAGLVAKVYPLYSEDYTKADVTTYNNKVTQILSGVDESWTELQKALYLHDYLVSHAKYDLTYQHYDAYSLLVEGKGVCQAYALAYMALLNGAELANGTVSSNQLNHIWNLVEVDGAWYHVDATWDDPTNSAMAQDANAPDLLGSARHTYFLLSEATMREGAHDAEDWCFLPEQLGCTSDIYESGNWFGSAVKTAFVPLNGKWYYLQNDTGHVCRLYQTDDPKTGGSAVAALGERWLSWTEENSYWAGPYCGLWSWRGQVVYNSAGGIYGYDPQTETVNTLLRPDTTRGWLYGLLLEGDEATCLMAQDPRSLTAWALKRTTLLPYRTVNDGGYSVCQQDGTFRLRLDAGDGSRLVLARYDGSGRMLELQALTAQNAELLLRLKGDGSALKVFALSPEGTPRCAADSWQDAA